MMTEPKTPPRPLRIGVLGGSGFVGKQLAETWPVECRVPPTFFIHRSHPGWLNQTHTNLRNINLNDETDIASALAGHDVLVNLLRPDGTGWYPELMRQMQKTFHTSGVFRCVHASSIDVYAGVSSAFVDERTLPQPLSPYEKEHCEAEAILSESFPETVILRLGAVFGWGGQNLVSLSEELRQGPSWKSRARRLLYGDRRLHLVSVETVAKAIWRSASEPIGQNGSRIIIVTEDRELNNNFAFVQDAFAEAFGAPNLAGTRSLPRDILKFALHLRGVSYRNVNRRYSPETMSRLGLDESNFNSCLRDYARQLATAQESENF